jgi:Protein of unknown function (DUF3761)
MKPKLIPAALIAALLATPSMACPPGYYSRACVESPDQNRDYDRTAECRDGTESHSRHASSTCSSHGGVADWDR